MLALVCFKALMVADDQRPNIPQAGDLRSRILAGLLLLGMYTPNVHQNGPEVGQICTFGPRVDQGWDGFLDPPRWSKPVISGPGMPITPCITWGLQPPRAESA